MATEAPQAPVLEKHVETKKKPRAPASHPPYIEMIQEAIISLKEKTGSSQYAITKFIDAKHKNHIPPNFKKLLLIHLRKLTAAGKLTKVKNSYKIPAAAAVKPKAKFNIAKPKPKPKTKSLTKLKPVAKIAKPKPKTAAAKPTKLPPKEGKISEKDASVKAKGKVAAKKKTRKTKN